MNDFCTQKKITKKIKIGESEEQEFTFYAIPYGTVLKMRTLGKPISKLLAAIMTDKSKDTGVETLTRASELTDAQGDAYVDQHVTQKEISPSLASLRYRQFTEAVEGMTELLLSDDVKDIIGEIIVKSCKDHFSEDDRKELHDKIPIDMMIQLLSGAFEASAGGLSDLGKFLSPQLKKNLQKTSDAVKENLSGN